MPAVETVKTKHALLFLFFRGRTQGVFEGFGFREAGLWLLNGFRFKRLKSRAV